MSEPELQEAFIAGAEWADDQCPVHAYPKLVRKEAEKRYPEEGKDVRA